MAQRKRVYRFFMCGPFPPMNLQQWKSRHQKLLTIITYALFTGKRHFPMDISPPAIILQCNANDSFALAIKLLRIAMTQFLFDCVLAWIIFFNVYSVAAFAVATWQLGNRNCRKLHARKCHFSRFALFLANITKRWTRCNNVENIFAVAVKWSCS